MTTLHMETEAVRAMANQFKMVTETLRGQALELNNSIKSIAWIGPSREEFEIEGDGLIRQLDAQAEAGIILADNAAKEISEWEQVAANLGSLLESTSLPFSGGGNWNWSTVPTSPLSPFFTLVTVAPLLDELPKWMGDLYSKFFPTPVPIPTVISPIPEESVPKPRTGSFGDLINQPVSPAQASASGQPQSLPTASVLPSREGYETYYEIPPKAQGAEYGNAACLPTSLSMVTDYYHNQNSNNKAATPHELVQMLDPGDGTSGKGVTFNKLNDDLGELGYKETRFFQSDITGLKNELKNGPVVVNVKVNLTSTPTRTLSEGNGYNHAVLVKGVSEQNVLINDPWTGKEMEISTDKFDRMWKNGDHWAETVHP